MIPIILKTQHNCQSLKNNNINNNDIYINKNNTNFNEQINNNFIKMENIFVTTIKIVKIMRIYLL